MSIGTESDVAVGLDEIRRRRRTVWLVFFGYVPIVTLIWFATHSDRLAIGAAAVWMALFALVIIRLGVSKCPRCGKRFHQTWYWHNPFTSSCLHSGLKLRLDAHA